MSHGDDIPNADWTHPINAERTTDMAAIPNQPVPIPVPVTGPVFDISDDEIGQLVMQTQGIIEGQNPGSFAAPAVGVPIDWSKAKTLLKTLFPFVLAVFKTKYPNVPIEQIIELLNIKIDGFQAETPGLI